MVDGKPETGFVNQTETTATNRANAPEIGVGMLGHGFMGKAHTNAYKTLPYMMYPPAAMPKLVAIAGRSEQATRDAARRYGYNNAYTDWRDLVNDPAVQLFDNSGPNYVHAEPCIAAAQAGKHVFCEKPLGRTAEESYAMFDAVRRAGVKHMVAFNYRFVPAIRHIRNLIDAGAFGRIYHFRASYQQDWITDPNFPMVWRLDQAQAGTGAIGDLGTHIIDLARFLVGEPQRVMAMTRTFVKERLNDQHEQTQVTVDDAFAAVVDFRGGVLGTLEATRFAPGRKNYNVIEINAENGSVRFNLERLNELEVYWKQSVNDQYQTPGFTNVLVTKPKHPWIGNWWPEGHIIGWEHTFIHEIDHLLRAIVNNTDVAPYGATFEDGYRAAVISDAILQSNESGRAVDIIYKD